MKINNIILVALVIVTLLSCKNNKEETIETETPKTETTVPERVAMDMGALVENLQGTWKETEYPYRTAEFKGPEVKFVEEGVVDPPKFEAYQVATTCPEMEENANNSTPDAVYFYLPQNKLCQKITVTDEQFTLSGTSQDYKIVYERVNQ